MAAQRILTAPEMLTAEDIAALMGLSVDEILDAASDKTLLAVRTADCAPRFPAWQLDEMGNRRPGLVEVLELMIDGWDALRFFAASYAGVPNRERLMDGNVSGVLRSARLWVSADYG